MLKLVLNQNFLLACLADCPADNHARPLAQFLYETLACIVKKTSIKHTLKHFLYIFISLIILSCKSSKFESINPTGTYTLGDYNVDSGEDISEYFGKIQVKQIYSNKIVMTFMVNKGAPSYNSGSFIDTLDFENDQVIYTNPEMDLSCRITFNFTDKGVEVKEQTDDFNSGCGFGHAVVADGYFIKISSNIPDLRDPMTGFKIGRE